MRKHAGFSCTPLVFLFVVIVSLLALTPQARAANAPCLVRESLQVMRVPSGFEVRAKAVNPGSARTGASLEVQITDLEGGPVARISNQVALDPGASQVAVTLPSTLDESRIPLYMIQYVFDGPSGRETGAKQLVDAMAQLETRVVAYSNLLSGSAATVRVVALNHANQEPVANASVAIFLTAGDKEQLLHAGKTTEDGTLEAVFTVPDNVEGTGQLRITVASEGLGQDEVTQPVTVKRVSKILLTTDKPLYQPGQTIQMRALSLAAADLHPEAEKEAVFEVMDSKGNKVFKKKLATDAFGIAAADFELATEVNVGEYIVRAILGNTESEKQVRVERYVLPKYKIGLSADKDFYLPGETLKGEVQADYFFGKPVSAGKVTISASKFEVEFEEFATADGTLDDKGHWSFEIPLPEFFAGTPLEQGQASVRLEAVVVDTADHREEKVIMKPVAAAPLMVYVVPESGKLVPNLENRIHVLVAYPDGSPAQGATVVTGLDENKPYTTDDLGIVTIAYTPSHEGDWGLTVKARDKQGRSVEKQVTLEGKTGAEQIILRTDKTLYNVGETIRAEVYATKPSGTVYFDMVREGQTVMTQTADLAAGKASLEFDIDPSLFGSAVLQAYVFTPGTDIIRDTRLLYVNPADALNMNIALDKQTYRPGEQAQLRFAVTDASGKPTPAALGIAIVDESVFALQEIHPGLEKVYFTLEKEIMQPRYEIHGYEMSDIVAGTVPEGPVPVPKPAEWTAAQQRAAEVLLASSPEPPMPPVKVNTFMGKREAADQALDARMQRDLERVHRAISEYLREYHWDVPDNLVQIMLRSHRLRDNEVRDPWGNTYRFEFADKSHRGLRFTMFSNGPDGLPNTQDDLRRESWAGEVQEDVADFGGIAGGLVRGRMKVMAGAQMEVIADLAAPPPMAAPAEAAKPAATTMPTSGSAAGEPPAPRLREYFPETLLFEPALITDAQGVAVLGVDLADSITTWRMTAMASSKTGALGSKDSGILVFQDFFVDLDLPVSLTQHDKVSIPVVLYNYLEQAQDVRLKFEVEPWFKLEGEAERTISLQPGQVTSMYFPIEVVELGKHRLTVWAYGSQMSDAIRRDIEVRPDGEEQNVTFSDRLSAKVEHTIEIPGNAVEGASKILVRIYPGVYSQIVDGLDSMLQMPFGCFEQTSSVTYPNILVVQYMKATEQINPETQMKAEGFINAGYQRLLSYEVQGGGFSWFGDAPANKVLTAWGLKEFCDMAEVHEVDPAVIERTRAWLLSKQEADGSWKPDEQYLHAESWAGIQNSGLLVTAYIAEAVLGTGGKGAEADKAISYIRDNWESCKEPYTLALVANALVAWNPKDAWTLRVLEKLHDMRVEEKDTAHWKGGSGTVTFTEGDAADIETTALATIAFLNANRYPETTTKALTYIIQKKSAQGHWGSTQATILALKALMLSLGSRTETVNAKVTVALNGEQVSELAVTPEDCDVMRLVDLGEKTKAGSNTVTLTIDGEGSMLYQVVGRFYTPWVAAQPEQAPMSIEVAYDKTRLAVNDMVTARVKVTNNRPNAAQMIIVDLGIPPGFEVQAADLEKLVENKTIQKYEMTGRQIIVYFERIDGNGVIEFQYALRAKFPLRAQTPSSRVYDYYNPENEGTASPQAILVE
ncbi:MAG TPA: MG2 domain-containing protein [Candidatus Hydrogenedentes bacterium]|nr:MG2 domain-containing protein [Candidatus Hydrogenedentota bacterium]